MTIRVTMLSNDFDSYGNPLLKGQTYSLADEFAKSLILSLKASDTDGILSSPQNTPFDLWPLQNRPVTIEDDGAIQFGKGSDASLAFQTLLDKYKAPLAGEADAGPAVQLALNDFAAFFPGAVARFPNACTLRLETGISIDVGKMGCNFGGAIINPIGAITALSLVSTAQPENNNLHPVGCFEIDGDLTAGQRGLFIYSPNPVVYGPGPSRVQLHNYSIKQCDVGYEFGDAAYGIENHAWHIYENNTGIKQPSGLIDAYEMPKFYSGFLANNVLGINLGDGQLSFFGSHIDYNRKQATITGGRILLVGCHVESNLKRSTYSVGQTSFDLSGKAVLQMTNGRLIYTNGTSGTDLDRIFNVTTTAEVGGGVWLKGVTLSNCKPLADYMAKGSGNVFLDDCVADSDTPMPLGVHDTYNLLDYGTFEGTFPIDNINITAGGTITSRVASSNVTLAQGAAAARTGSNGLIVTKVTASGASGTADFVILAPVRSRAAMHNGGLWYRHNGTSTRQVTFQFGYFKTLQDVFGSQCCHQVKDVAYSLNSTVTLPGADTGWVQVKPSIPYRRPPKAMEWVGWRIRVHDMNATETLFIDDVEIHQF